MSATISSRTPEGLPNTCPVCGADVRVEPSQPLGDAPCPCCGHLLWFLKRPAGADDLERQATLSTRDRVMELLFRMGIERHKRAQDSGLAGGLELDSLDMAELILALEEEGEER